MAGITELRAIDDPLERNRRLFEWLQDDDLRDAFYQDLRDKRCPALRVKSLLGPDRDGWPLDDLYVLSSRSDVGRALQTCSVAPYADLDSGGRFMLGLDNRFEHDRQHETAWAALQFSSQEIQDCVDEAWRLASILPLKNHDFDLAAGLAEQAALRFAELLFGLPSESHVFLQRLMAGAYRRLSFQIIGRHFVGDSGLPRADDPRARQARDEIEREIREVALQGGCGAKRRRGEPACTVIAALHKQYGGLRIDDTVMVTLGLIAGTIGNVCAAVTIAIDDLLSQDGERTRLDVARRAAWVNDGPQLRVLISMALLRHPPAPFLAREASSASGLLCDGRPIPAGATLLLLMGVEPSSDLLFGGRGFMHRCVGREIAWPLIQGIVREVLRLPGLDRVLDPGTGKPLRPKKLWGAVCQSYKLQYARHRRLNQQPLFVVLPIREPVRENADRLRALTEGGACIVEDALSGGHHVHFAWFNIIEGGTHLAMSTVYDGDFDAYVEFFATSVPLFDRQFKYLAVDQEFPIKDHPKQFVDNIRKYDRTPLGRYFFSAYPTTTVADIENAGLTR